LKYLDANLPSHAPHREYTNEQRVEVVRALIAHIREGQPVWIKPNLPASWKYSQSGALDMKRCVGATMSSKRQR
ncbi:MAG: hypothetical protein ACR2H4_04905, partial [Pyrinomonadaceae bacterium]